MNGRGRRENFRGYDIRLRAKIRTDWGTSCVRKEAHSAAEMKLCYGFTYYRDGYIVWKVE